MRRISMAILWLLAAITMFDRAHAGDGKPQVAQATQGRELLAAMDVVVAPDGAITSVVPDATLPEPIRQLLVKRVSQWRYEAPMWLGKPAQLSTRMILALQPVPTTSGGYALRVLRQAHEADTGPVFSPRFPEYPYAAKRRGVGGVFVYSMRAEADGSLTHIQRRHPQDVDDNLIRALDESAQAFIQDAHWRPFIVDGAPVACDVLMPITFTVTGSPPPANIDLKPVLDTMTERCPRPVLATKIENLIL